MKNNESHSVRFDDLRAFQNSLRERGIAGNDLAVFVGYKPVYRYMTGYQNVEESIPIHRDTMYRMYSMTKPVTVAAAMQLYEKGKFLLNEPLSDYMPEFREMYVAKPQLDGSWSVIKAEKPILIQHLFEMTAGFDYDTKSPELMELYEKTGGRHTLRDVCRALAKRPLCFEPGTHWQYSFCHDVLAGLVEVISGMTFGEYLKKNIFEPLHMESASHHPSEARCENYCLRYGLDENGEFVRGPGISRLHQSPNYGGGGAGLSMTVDDYARFACAMSNHGVSEDGVRILASGTIDLIRQNRLNKSLLQDYQDRWQERLPGYGYGLGVRMIVDPAEAGTLAAKGEFGWSGAWGTYVLMDPDHRVTIVYGEQATDPQSPYIQRRIRNLVYAALEYETLLG